MLESHKYVKGLFIFVYNSGKILKIWQLINFFLSIFSYSSETFDIEIR